MTRRAALGNGAVAVAVVAALAGLWWQQRPQPRVPWDPADPTLIRYTAAHFGPEFFQRWSTIHSGDSRAPAALRAGFRQRLRPSVANALAQATSPTPTAALAQDLADDTNVLLDDAAFVASLSAACGADGTAVAPDLVALLSLPDARLLQWLVLQFDDRGLFDPGVRFPPGPNREARRTVNALVLSPLFGRAVPMPPVIDLSHDAAQTRGKSRFEGLAESLAEEERERPLDRKLEALEHPVRQRLLPPTVVVRELGVRPGMEIVDIGAGGGHLSLPMAAALAGQGQVWAVDVDPRMVELLEQRARDQGLATLTAVHLQPDDDPFYQGHTFDLAVLCSVYEYLGAPDAFFTMLASTLRPGSGRLAILQGHTAERWFPTDFGAPFRPSVLRATAPNGPVWTRLRTVTQTALLALAPTETADALLQGLLAKDFAPMLDDHRLVIDMLSAQGPAGEPAGTWLARLGPDDRQVLGGVARMLGRRQDMPWTTDRYLLDRAALRTVNWLALLPFFDESLPREVYPRGIYLTPKGIARRLARVGFRLERTVTALPAHDFLVFKVETPAR